MRRPPRDRPSACWWAYEPRRPILAGSINRRERWLTNFVRGSGPPPARTTTAALRTERSHARQPGRYRLGRATKAWVGLRLAAPFHREQKPVLALGQRHWA